MDVLVQVNTSGEDAKGGFSAQEAVEAVHAVADLPGLKVQGLMTMAPFIEDEAIVGAFEGAMYEAQGLYRPSVDCIMFTRDEVGFCQVCRGAIERIIDMHTR